MNTDFKSWTSRLALLFLLLALLVAPAQGAGLVQGLTQGVNEQGAGYDRAGRPIAPAPSFHGFTLIGLSDVHGKLQPTAKNGKSDPGAPVGGTARVATLFKRAKAANPGAVLALSAGDDLSGVYFRALGAASIYPLMRKAGYELVAPGNHEFDRGPKLLAESIQASGLEVLCTDLRVTATPLEGLCAPYELRVLGGVKVGFFSLMSEDFPVLTRGDGVALSAGNEETARRMVALLREKGAAVVVAITHIGLERDKQLAQAAPGLDIIFGGHSHQAVPEKLVVGRTLVVNGGEKSKHVIQIDAHVTEQGAFDPASSRYALIPVSADIEPDKDVQAAVDKLQQALPPAMRIGSTDAPWDFSSGSLRVGRSAASYLVCDLLRSKFKADVTLFNAGAFRGDGVYPAGPITDAMLRDIDAFESAALLVSIQGKHLPEILERSAATYGEGGLLIPSGLRYVVDLAKPAQVLGRDAEGKLAVTEPGQRLVEAQILDQNGAWAAIDPEKYYRVLVNPFLHDNDGDGYFWFKRFGKDAKNSYAPFGAILASTFEQSPVLTPPALDDRVVARNAP
jgi:5'-nucleotidase